MVTLRIRRISIAAFALASFVFASCSSDDPTAPPVDNEHAPPTTITVELVKLDAAGNPTTEKTTATVRDTTVVKGKPRVEGLLQLDAGAKYRGSISLFDESKSPAENVTHEIVQEKDGHIFLFAPGGGLDASRIVITDKDKDSQGFDVGLSFMLQATAGPSVNGTINVQLRHYDSGNKNDTVYDTDINSNIPAQIR